MAILTVKELAALRRAVGEGVVPITWDKTTINTATQGVEDILEAQGFDAASFVTVAVAPMGGSEPATFFLVRDPAAGDLTAAPIGVNGAHDGQPI